MQVICEVVFTTQIDYKTISESKPVVHGVGDVMKTLWKERIIIIIVIKKKHLMQ